jgi:hypothetical protein
MAIIMHPLTAKNGTPTYTADDYRHAINPLLVPSDGSAFNGLSGIRYGSPSPLITVSGLTVTVKPHCGTISPWDGLGAYTYAITTNTTVQLADSTNDYKIAVTVEDPSQSHGTTPRGKIEVFTAGTPDSNINGLVIAKVNAGVASDAAPMIRNNAVLMARDLTQLNTIDAVDGQEAVTIADNAHYVKKEGAWKPVFETVRESWQGGTISVIYGESSCAVQVTGVRIGSGSWDSVQWGKTIRKEYRPEYEMSSPVMITNGASNTGFLVVKPEGLVRVQNMGASGSGDTRSGSVCWPVPRQY